MAFVLAVMLAMTLVITGGEGAVLHEGGPWQIPAPNLQSYLQVSGIWPIPDPTASVPLPRYAFAQVSDNMPLVVQAGGDLTVGEGNTVMLSGSATDPDGDPITYTWSQTGPVTPRITFADASASSTTFTAPSVTGDTTFTFVLTAHGGTQSVTDTLNVTVKETGAAFITTWIASDSDRDITLPTMGTYSILWGDGSHSPDVSGSQFHSYDAAGNYTVTVLGEGLENIYLYGDPANARQLRSIEQWGDTKWITMNGAFGRAANMVYHATDAPNLSGVTDMTYMFFNTASFDGNLSGWDVSSVTYMTYMFLGASAFNGDISGWDVSSVTNMYHTFEGTSAFNGDISGWDVSSVTDMNSMFFFASTFNGDISGWDVSSVTNMGNMFLGASSFDRPLDSWDVSSVTAMPSMFVATPAFNQNLGTWYIVPARTDFDASGNSLDVTTISAQNPYLNGQNPIYGMGSGGNSDLFEMRGSTLAFRNAPDVGSYTANVRASGSGVFENGNNWRMLEITVRDSANDPPTVDAGQDQTVNEGDTLTLNGTASDHEGDQLTYLWSHESALPITVSNATSPLTTFIAPTVDSDATVTFVLSVSDGTNADVTDQVTITIQDVPTNYPPTVDAGQDQTVNEGDTLTLNGTASDHEGDQLTYLWSHESALPITVSNVTSPLTTFIAPTVDSDATVTFVLSVSDGTNADVTDQVTITIQDVPTNYPPTVDAGQDQTVNEGDTLTLNGTASDHEGDQLTYLWSHESALPITVSNVTSPLTTFIAPTVDSDATVTFVLSVSDGTNADVTDQVTITIQDVPTNYPPTVDAGQDQTVNEGDTLTLNGTASDPEGDQLTYLWSHESALPITVSNATSPLTTFIAPTVDSDVTVTFVLSVSDGTNADVTDQVTITIQDVPTNYPPTVDAGQDQTVNEGDTLTLNGTASDHEGDQLTYLWSHESALPITVSNVTSPLTTFIAPTVDSDATVTFVLSVSDGTNADVTDQVTITIQDVPTNYPPTVDAGQDQTVNEGDTLTLNGTASDHEGDQLTYLWSHESALPITVSNVTSPLTTFIAPTVDSDATVTFVLSVSDGTNADVTDQVTITIQDVPTNYPPTVDAGQDQTVNEGDTLTLNGTASDHEGDQLTYLWSHESALPITVSNVTSPLTTFIAPTVDSDATVTFVLSVSDGTNADVTDQVTITIQDVPTNYPPTVDAGQDQTVNEGDTLTLNGTASDHEGDQLTYLWSHESALPITVSNVTSPLTTFIAPTVDSDATVTFVLSVSDGTNADVTDQVTITIQDVPTNNPPTVDAGQDQTVNEGDTLTLNGTASDHEGDQLTYLWSHESALPITVSNATSPLTTFIAPTVDSDATVTFVLSVSDGTNADVTDQVTITIQDVPTNNPPTVDAGQDQTVNEGDTLTLNGTASDADGDALTYLWSHDSDLEITLDNPSSVSVSFTVPQVTSNATITFTMTVTDKHNATGSDAVVISILDVPADDPQDPIVDQSQKNTVVWNMPEPHGPRDISRITLSSVTPGIIQATWEASSEASANYRISWTKVGERYLTWTNQTGNAFPTDPSQTITGLNDGEAYKVKVRASYAGTSGDWSDDVTITVAETVSNTPATGLPVIGGTVQVGQTLTVDASGIADVNGMANATLSYQWVSSDGATDTDITEATTSRYVLTAGDQGRVIQVQVTFTDDAGHAESLTSNATVAVTFAFTVPGVPTGLSVLPGDSGALNVSWQTPISDGGSAITGYTIQWKAASGSWTVPADVSEATATGTTYTITGLTDGTSYTVRIIATNQVGNGEPTPESTAIPITPQQLGPRDIGKITLSSTTPGVIDASWDAPVEAPAAYRISWAKVGESYKTWTDRSGNAFPTATSQTITGLEKGEAYKVKVRATYKGTSGDWNGNATITVAETVTNTPVTGLPVVQVVGGDQTVGEGYTVRLSGSVTDPDDDSITYTWSQTDPATPLITFANASAPSATFTAPQVTGDTTFILVLTADYGTQSVTDTLNVTVKETGTAFITTWAASDSDRSITLPMMGTYSILWGDGSHSPEVSGSQSHTYGAAGNYTVTVLGDGLEYIRLYGDAVNARQLRSIEQWGGTKWTTMDGAFGRAANMVYRATDTPNLSGVTSMSSMFTGASSFDGDLSSWDVSGVTYMGAMFRDATPFNGNLSSWDVSGVTDMINMFHGATSFNGNLSAWNVSGVTDMGGMFFEARSFNGDLSAWDVSGVTDMFVMFHDATPFNGNLSAWDVSGVTYMGGMFHGATSFNGDLSAWDVSGVTDMSSMFHEARSFNGDLSAWNVSGVTDMSSMFDRATFFNGNLSAWNVSGVTDMNGMFYRAISFNGDLSTWDVSKVTKMIYMFRGTTSFNGDLSTWDVSKVTGMSGMFHGATSFNGDLSSWDISKVTDMSGMFHGATSFNGDLSSWDVSKVTDMSGMFHGATSFNQNLGTWYVVLDGDTMPSSTDSIGIAAQNRILNGQNPIYTIDGAATNGDKFRIANGTHLALRADQTVAQGQYNVTIKSTGSFGVGNSRIVEITVGEDAVPQTNNPLSVEAGPAQVVPEGSKVRLNGSATDPDGDHLIYSWSHDSTLDISLANASASSTTFTAPQVTGDTTFILVLTADDGTQSATDTLNVTVKETGTAFITTWTASNYDRSITLPMMGTYSILWGDGSHSPEVSGSQSHTYGAAGTYTVTVLGDGLESVNLRNDTVNALQLRSIEQWGDTKWTVMEEAFDGAVNMVYRATDAPDLSGVTDMSRMFNGASAFNGDISGWNVSSVTDMSSMFNGTTAFNQNLGTWYIVPAGTSPDVTTISAQNPYLSGQNPTYGMGSGGDSDLFEMRGSTLAFMSTPDADSYTANVTASGSAVFESGNNWRMLEITVSGPPVVQARGDQTVGEGDTVRLSGSATDPNDDSITYTWSQVDPAAPLITFANASAPSTTFTAPQVTGDTVFTLVLTADDGTYSATDTLSITVKETGTAFITTWTASNSDRSITLPIKGAYSILWGDGTYSANVGGSQSHTYGAAGNYTVTVLGDGLGRIHLYSDNANARQLRSIEQWGDTKWISMYESFYGAVNMVYRATDAPNLSGVTNMNRMFAGATAINGDLSGWDVSSVTDMSSMFYTAYAFNGDLSGWDVSSVITMRYMFFGAHAFNGDLSGWDVSSVSTMNGMFSSAHVFNGNLSGWDVSSVTDMGSMFYEAVTFNQLLDGWDVSSVTDMDGMFHSAYTFNQSLDDWDVSSVTYMRNMFYDAVAFNQNLGTWYIVPAGTDFDAGGDSLIVTTVSAQNLYLGDHNLTYGIGSGGDSDLFEMTGSTLAFKSAPNADSYTVKVTASGNDVFENGNNWRMLEITVHDSADG